jgi:hypothetical protein
MRTARTHHYEGVRSARAEHLEDFGEREQLIAYLLHPVAGIRDVDLVGLHEGPSAEDGDDY